MAGGGRASRGYAAFRRVRCSTLGSYLPIWGHVSGHGFDCGHPCCEHRLIRNAVANCASEALLLFVRCGSRKVRA